LAYKVRRYAAAGNGLNGWRPRKLHYHLELAFEMLEHTLNAASAAQRKAVHQRAADRHGARPKRQGAEYILTAANAAIDNDWATAIHGLDDAWQHIHGRGHIVELASTVVRDPHTGAAVRHRLFDVLERDDRLNDNGQSRFSSTKGDVVPGQVALPRGSGDRIDARRPRFVATAKIRRSLTNHTHDALAIGYDRSINRNDDDLVARSLGPLEQFTRKAAVNWKIDLKPFRPGA